MDEQQDIKAQQTRKKLGRRGKKKKEDFFIEVIEMGKNGIQTVDMKAKGGRAGFKSGSKGCKLAMKGKGRAYGKNS